MVTVRQLNFAAGEIAPALYGRVDQVKHNSGLRTCRNMFVLKSGGVQSRPGSIFVAEARSPTLSFDVRLVKFIGPSDNNFVLEFGDFYVRFYRNGTPVLETGIAVSAITKASVAVVTANAHGFTSPDEVYISGLVGMPQMNGRFIKPSNVATNTFEAKTTDLVNINSTSYSDYVSGGTAQRLYRLSSPYGQASLAELDFAQNGNKLVIVHPDFAPRELTFTSETSWAFSTMEFDSVDQPIFVSSSTGVPLSTISISAITAANPAVFTTSAAHGLENNDRVTITGATGGTFGNLNNGVYYVSGVISTTSTTLNLRNESGTLVDTTGFGTYTGSGIFSILEHTRYKIVSVDSDTGEESQACSDVTASITNITQASEGLVTTSSAHGFFDGDEILITFGSSTPTMTQVNNRRFRVKQNPSNPSTTFFLAGENTTSYTAYASGSAFAIREYIRIPSNVIPSSETLPNTIIFQKPSAEIEQFNVYRSDQDGIYGFITSLVDVSGQSRVFFKDPGYTADLSSQPPISFFPFSSTGNYPSVVGFYQQRLLLASSDNEPEAIWTSRIGAITAFATSLTVGDDGPIKFVIRGSGKIQHLVDIRKLLVFAKNGEYVVNGSDAGALTPSAINVNQQSYNGSSRVSPVVIDGVPIYMQRNDSIIRDIAFGFEEDRYTGVDLTTFSSHLTAGYSIVDQDFQQSPHSILWSVRSDGTLIGLTYIREHQVLGWHRHDTSEGLSFERICIIPEGGQDYLYAIVRRTVEEGDGAGFRTARYVERFATAWRAQTDIVEANFLDSSLVYDGRNTNTSHTMTLSGGTDWTAQNFITITSSVAGYFGTGTIADANIGNRIDITGPSGDVIRLTITGIGTGGNTCAAQPNRTIPTDMRNVALSSWSRSADEIHGLWHLEGRQVCVYADGYVVSNPLNPASSILTVSNGSITLPQPYPYVRVGLPYVCDIETLDIDTAQGQSLIDKKKLITQVTLFVERSRGVWIGSEAPDSDSEDGTLYEYPSRELEEYDDKPDLITGPIKVSIKGEWNEGGRVFVRQRDPLPLTILSVAPSGLIQG